MGNLNVAGGWIQNIGHGVTIKTLSKDQHISRAWSKEQLVVLSGGTNLGEKLCKVISTSDKSASVQTLGLNYISATYKTPFRADFMEYPVMV